MKNPLFFACTFSSTEFRGSRPDAAASLKGQTVAFLSHLTFLPTAVWGHSSNGAWGQLPRVQGKGLERHYTSAVSPNRHLHLFLLQNRHQQGFARLFVTTWNCSPPGTPDIITNGSRDSVVKNKIPVFFCVKPWHCCPASLILCAEWLDTEKRNTYITLASPILLKTS